MSASGRESRLVTPWRLGLLGMFIASVLVYLPSMKGQPMWDDELLMNSPAAQHATFVSAFTTPFLGNYARPLTSLSLLFDRSYSAGNPFGYHQTNILLHAVTTVLVCCLALLLSEKPVAAVFSGLFFMVQPLQIGAVAWIGGRCDAMATLFVSIFLIALVQYHKSGRPWLLAGSVGTLLLAVLSKEQCLALLPIVPVSTFVFGSKKWKDSLRISIPFVLVPLVFIAAIALGPPPTVHAQNWGLLGNVSAFLQTVVHYATGILLPHKEFLGTYSLQEYSHPIVAFFGILYCFLLVVVIVANWKNNRAISWLIIAAGLAIFPVTNLVSILPLLVGPYRIAIAGPAIACALGMGAIALDKRQYRLLGIGFTMNLVYSGVVCLRGIGEWADMKTYFSNVVTDDRGFLRGHIDYATALERDGKPKEAIETANDGLIWIFGTHYWSEEIAEKGAEALDHNMTVKVLHNDGSPTGLQSVGKLVYAVAVGQIKLNNHPEALLHLRQALLFEPDGADVHEAIGVELLASNRSQAIQELEAAARLAPNDTGILTALAKTRLEDGRYSEAERLLLRVVSTQDQFATPWLYLTDARIGLGDLAGAEQSLRKAENAWLITKDQIEIRRQKIEKMRSARKME